MSIQQVCVGPFRASPSFSSIERIATIHPKGYPKARKCYADQSGSFWDSAERRFQATWHNPNVGIMRHFMGEGEVITGEVYHMAKNKTEYARFWCNCAKEALAGSFNIANAWSGLVA
jgi:hypothetical protein